MQLVKVISTRIANGGIRLIKFLRMGLFDVQETKVAAPYGVDSNPIEDMVAVYAETSEKGNPVIIGYLNKNQIADIGEYRTFSTDEDGVEQFYMHLKNDGIAEIGGDTDFMVRYSELESAFNELRDDYNAFLIKYNAHVHPGVVVGPGSTLITPSVESPSTADISGAKIDEIKTI